MLSFTLRPPIFFKIRVNLVTVNGRIIARAIGMEAHRAAWQCRLKSLASRLGSETVSFVEWIFHTGQDPPFGKRSATMDRVT